MPVKYERVDRALVHEIFTRHVLQGEPLLDHVLDGPVEKVARARNPRLRQSARAAGTSGERAAATLTEKLRERGIAPDQVAGDAGELLRRLRRRRDRASCSHLLVRPDKVLYRVAERRGPRRDHRAAPRSAARWSSGWRCRARRSGGSSSRSTATWRSSTGRPASPCATTA